MLLHVGFHRSEAGGRFAAGLTATVRAHASPVRPPPGTALQFASLGWDTCLEEILPALTAGATLVFDDGAHSGSMPRFVRTLAEQEITVLDRRHSGTNSSST